MMPFRGLQSYFALLALLGAVLFAPTAAQFDWTRDLNQAEMSSGDVTSYGAGQDNQGACSYGANFADTTDLAWKTGVPHTVALNQNQFGGGLACGMCILYRGLGDGLGTMPIPVGEWNMGLVTNVCPECAHGDIDIAYDGNGRWLGEWFAVPCNVGNTNFQYNIVVSSYYWFSMVVSNTRVPVSNVSVKIGENWRSLTRSSNNQWAYYNEAGPWQENFPMGVRILSVTGEEVEDAIASTEGGPGSVQFTEVTPFAGITPQVLARASIPPDTGLSMVGGEAVLEGAASTMYGPSGNGTAPTTPSNPAYTAPADATSPTAARDEPEVQPPAEADTVPAEVQPPAEERPAEASATRRDDMYGILNFNQCGGTSGVCGESGSPCIPEPWPRAYCSTEGWTCRALRGSTEFFSCQEPEEGTSVTTASSPSPSPSSSLDLPPNVTSSPSPSPSATITSSPSPSSSAINTSSPSPSPSAINTSSPSPSPSAKFTSSPSPSPSAITFSSPSPSVASARAASPSPSTSSPSPSLSGSTSPSPRPQLQGVGSGGLFPVGAGYQCGGGAYNCGQTDTPCQDAQWEKAQCPDGYACQRENADLWSCKSSLNSGSVATGGRRLLHTHR